MLRQFPVFCDDFLYFRFWADRFRGSSYFAEFMRSPQGLRYMGFLDARYPLPSAGDDGGVTRKALRKTAITSSRKLYYQ